MVPDVLLIAVQVLIIAVALVLAIDAWLNWRRRGRNDGSIVIPEQTMSTQGHSLRCRSWDARPCNCGKQETDDAE